MVFTLSSCNQSIKLHLYTSGTTGGSNRLSVSGKVSVIAIVNPIHIALTVLVVVLTCHLLWTNRCKPVVSKPCGCGGKISIPTI